MHCFYLCNLMVTQTFTYLPTSHIYLPISFIFCTTVEESKDKKRIRSSLLSTWCKAFSVQRIRPQPPARSELTFFPTITYELLQILIKSVSVEPTGYYEYSET